MKVVVVAALFFATWTSFAQQPRFGTIAGQLRNADGTPAAAVRITATTVGLGAETISSQTQTDLEGRYRLVEIPPESYVITAGALVLPTYFPGVTVREQARTISVAAGQALTNMNFTVVAASTDPQAVREGPRLTVPWTVTMDDGSTVPGLVPYLSVEFGINGDSGKWCCIAGQSRGPLELTGLFTGSNFVAVTKVPLGYFVKSLTFAGVDLTKAALVLPSTTEGAKIEVVLTRNAPRGAIPGFKVAGRVTNLDLPRSKHIGLVLREISPTGGGVLIGKSPNEVSLSADRKDGSFEIAGVPSGRYELRFDRTVEGAPIFGVTIDVVGSNVTNVELSFGAAR